MSQWDKFLKAYKNTEVTIIEPKKSLKDEAIRIIEKDKKGGNGILDLLDEDESSSSCGCNGMSLIEGGYDLTIFDK